MKEKIIEILKENIVDLYAHGLRYGYETNTPLIEEIAGKIERLIDAEVERRIAERDELIILLNAYATFLGKIIDKNAGFLHVHGIHASDEEIKTGQKYRDDIQNVINRLTNNSQKTEGGGE